MDPVTERLLERTRARREQLAKKMNENNSSPRKRRAPLADNNSQDEDEIQSPSPVKTSRASPSPVKQSRASPLKPSRASPAKRSHSSPPKTSRQISMEIKPDTPAISSVRTRMQSLSQQRAVWSNSTEGQEMDSPKNVCAPRHHVIPSPDLTHVAPAPQGRKSRFAALAANINNWEDDTHHPVHKKEEEKKPVRVWQPPKPSKEPEPSQPIPAMRNNAPTTTTHNSPVKKQAPTQSKTWTYQPPTITKSEHVAKSPMKEGRGQIDFHTTAARAHLRVVPNDSPKPSPRAASNKTVNIYGEKVTLQPVASTTKSTPATVGAPRQIATVPKQPTTPPKKEAPPRMTKEVRAAYSSTSRERVVSPVKRVAPKKASAVLSPSKQEPRIGALAMSVQQRLKEHERNWQSNDINRKIQEERKKEMEALKMRWAYPKPRPPTPELEEDEEEEEEEEEDEPVPDTMQHVSLPEPEPEIVPEQQELTEQTPYEEEEESMEEESMEDNQEEGYEEEEESEQDETQDDTQGDMNITDVLGDIDELIDEAEAAMQEEQQKSEDEAREAEKRKRQEVRFSDYEGSSSQTDEEQEVPPPSKVPRAASSSSSNDEEATNQSMVYSINAYRKNQSDMKKIVREEEVKTPERGRGSMHPDPMYDTPRALPQVCPKQKIKALMEEVSAQQSIIHQTTQALNLIASNDDYKGSMEEVEAERLLLLATQRRHACLNEIQRLKNPPAKQGVLMTSEGEEIVPCSGSVTIQDIRLPLKTEYVLNQSSNNRACHYYIVLFRQRENVIATQMLSTIDGLSGDCLPFTNLIAMNNIDSDFIVEVGVFEMHVKKSKMEAHGENKSKSSLNFLNALTPRKLKSMKSKMPAVSSPGGPGAVRSSSFTLMGTSRLSLASSKVNRFTLSKVPFNSPLEGSVHLKLTCRTKSNVTFHGWLTMFDDINGYGAWHRRWCVLNNGFISYWTFPDQEKIKPPIGSVDLTTSTTEEVAPISRILCARPNTFEIITCRPASKYDKETLVTKPSNSITSTMHRLSADTKEERIEWIDALNTVLLDLRTWNKDPRLN